MTVPTTVCASQSTPRPERPLLPNPPPPPALPPLILLLSWWLRRMSCWNHGVCALLIWVLRFSDPHLRLSLFMGLFLFTQRNNNFQACFSLQTVIDEFEQKLRACHTRGLDAVEELEVGQGSSQRALSARKQPAGTWPPFGRVWAGPSSQIEVPFFLLDSHLCLW